MKNQYVGDVGDYGKYGLLRFLAKRGIEIGVNWYLTKKDSSNDGKFREYLDDKNEESRYDKAVFSALQSLKSRNVREIEKCGIIPGAVFFSEELNTTDVKYTCRKALREDWFQKSILALESCKLVFADPDNGSAKDEKITRKNGEKYVILGELKRYYDSGKDVVYYCHKGRRKDDVWQEKMVELKTLSPQPKIFVLTFHRGTQRSYIFAVHPERCELYESWLKEFMETDWGTVAGNSKQPPFSREII